MKHIKSLRCIALLTAICMIIMLFCMFVPQASANEPPDVQFYTTQQIMDDFGILENRTPDETIVELTLGVKLNDYGDGEILNTNYTDYNYIWYDSRFSPGDLILTFLVYNPETQFTDDVIERIDLPVGTVYDIYGTDYIRSYDDLPEWAKPEMRVILDEGFINGGTDAAINPNDINMYMDDIRTVIICYRMLTSQSADVSRGMQAYDSPIGDTNRPRPRV